MLSPWPSITPRGNDTGALRTRSAALRRLVKAKSMSLRGYCPLQKKRGSGKEASGATFVRKKNPFEKDRNVYARKIRMPRGSTRTIDEEVDALEAESFDDSEMSHCIHVIQSTAFKDVVWPWWCRLQKDRSGTTATKDSYMSLSCNVLDYLVGSGEIPPEALEAASLLDWKVETEDEENMVVFMSQRLFSISMFRIAYLWSPTSDKIADLVQFLGELYVKINKRYGFFPTSNEVAVDTKESTVLRWPLKKDGTYDPTPCQPPSWHPTSIRLNETYLLTSNNTMRNARQL